MEMNDSIMVAPDRFMVGKKDELAYVNIIKENKLLKIGVISIIAFHYDVKPAILRKGVLEVAIKPFRYPGRIFLFFFFVLFFFFRGGCVFCRFSILVLTLIVDIV